MRHKIAVFAIAAMLAAGLGIAPALAAPAVHATASSSSLPAACRASFDPYKARVALLRSCRDSIYPLVAVKRLAGGGKEYIYDVAGVQSVTRIAPAGFRPLHASAAKLAEYGFPPRPSGGRALRAWQSWMRHERQVSPPRYLVGDAAGAAALSAPSGPETPATTVVDYPWAGNMAVSSSNVYTNVYATYNEPTTSDACGSGSQEGMWAGLGGYFSGTNAQAGTAVGVSGIKAHQAWYEFPAAGKPVAVNLYATAGKSFTAMVIREPGGYYIYLKNNKTGSFWNNNGNTVPYGPYDGRSAEAVMETITGHAIAHFDNFDVTDAEAAVNYGSYSGIADYSHYALEMQAVNPTTGRCCTGPILVTPGSATNDGATWPLDFQTC